MGAVTKRKMIPRLILFSKPATDWLKEASAALGVSTSEFVRRIVDEKRKRARY
jgi:hypothetical protein